MDAMDEPVSTLLLAAVTAEVKPLVRRRGMRRLSAERPLPAWVERRSSGANLLAVTGVGRQRAETVARVLLRRYQPRRVILFGFAGGLNPAYAVADVIVPASVMRAETGERFEPTIRSIERPVAPSGTLLSLDAPAFEPTEKQQLHEHWQADAADMETASLARLCDAAAAPWLCVRAISDPADAALPRFVTRLNRPDGRADPLAALRHVCRHPADLPSLRRLGRAAAAAADALARRLHPLLDGSGKSGRFH